MKNEAIKYILYARKSSEAEDRQVLSVESQIEELKVFANRMELNVIDVVSEERSATKPGRPLFAQVLDRIEQGEAQGILCWKLDRLSRNPIDGGRVSWMLQTSVIKQIQSLSSVYKPSDNVLTMAVELGMANQFVRDLSDNVKRGFRRKVLDGWITGVAPSGYDNTPDRQKGTKIIVRDPVRFVMVRRMWDMMLSENYTVRQIWHTANNKWGYRTMKRRKVGNNPLSLSALYKIFTNEFYYGEFEFPKGSGEWFKGAHEPMITKAEFERVQELLGGKGKPRPRNREFAFTGQILCGECGCQITAEIKNQLICSECKFKFAYENKSECPKCKSKIEEMVTAKRLHYEYYHCTKRKLNYKCSQKTILAEDLESQIASYLKRITINQKYLDWGIKHLRASNELQHQSQVSIKQNQQNIYDETVKKLDKLLDLRISGEINEAEFADKKVVLEKDKQRYFEQLNKEDSNPNQWLEVAEQTLTFACKASASFEEARKSKDLKRQKAILKALGQNIVLKDGILSIDAPQPFKLIEKAVFEQEDDNDKLEPGKRVVNKRKNTNSDVDVLSWLGSWDSNPGPIG